MTPRSVSVGGVCALLASLCFGLGDPTPARGEAPSLPEHIHAFQAPGDTIDPDTITGDTITGDTITGDTITGDTITGDTITGDTITGDTIRVDTTRIAPPDAPDLPGTPIRDDTLTMAGDTLPEVEGDSVVQVPPRNLPLRPGGRPARPEAGVWVWDREGLLSSEALTLPDLLTHIPGIVRLRGGDFGTPVAVTWAGLGPGQIRVYRDGIEDPPMEGGVTDLAKVGLSGISAVRVERGPGELRIHLQTLQLDDPRPQTVLEVATGDLQTNLFRASFAHPDFLGGTAMVDLDRLDTQGEGQNDEGAAFGTRLRYTFFHGERGGVAVDFRSRTTRRPPGVFTPREVSQSNWTVQGRWHLGEGLVGEAFATTASIRLGDESAPETDTLLPRDPKREVGVRLATPIGPGWVRGEAGLRSGRGWPSSWLELQGGAERDGLGGVSASWGSERWDGGETGHGISIRGWTAPRLGFSLFGEFEDGRRGVPFLVPRDLPPPPDDETDDPIPDPPEEPDDPDEPDPVEEVDPARFGERSGARAGARLQFRGMDVHAALLVAEADSLYPMGLPFDRNGLALPGGRRTGVEVGAHLPLTRLVEGLRIQGHLQFWDSPEWRYLPERNWMGSVSWHRTGYSGNLEVWTDIGARGRDAMVGPFFAEDGETLFQAPSNLSWYGRLQIRVITVRIFAHWENFTLRDDNLEFPGRPQPRTRALYGIRWVLRN